jgi:hypothetical protein
VISVSVYKGQQHFTYLEGGSDPSNLNIQDAWYDGAGHWHLQQINGTAVPDAPGASAYGNLSVSVYNGQFHVTYFTIANPELVQGAIHDAWYDGAGHWHLQQIAGVPVPGEWQVLPATPAAASPVFVSVYNGQQHFTYQDGNGNLQDVWYDGAGHWHLQQINNANNQGATVHGEYIASPVATAPATGGLFVSVYNDQQHFTYPDGNGNLQDVWYDGAGNWHLQQINGQAGVTVQGEWQATKGPVAFGGDLFVSEYNGQQHFTYTDENSNLQDAWYDGAGNWHLQQITNAADGGPTVPNEWIAEPSAGNEVVGDLFVSVYNGQQHFTYVSGDNGNIPDVWYDGNWHLQQINSPAGTGITGVTNGPGAYL